MSVVMVATSIFLHAVCENYLICFFFFKRKKERKRSCSTVFENHLLQKGQKALQAHWIKSPVLHQPALFICHVLKVQIRQQTHSVTFIICVNTTGVPLSLEMRKSTPLKNLGTSLLFLVSLLYLFHCVDLVSLKLQQLLNGIFPWVTRQPKKCVSRL